MCGRYALTAPASTIAEVFQVDVLPDVLPRYNIAPTSEVQGVVMEDGARKLQSFRWGLIPGWAKDKKIAYQTINARADSVATKPAYRAAFKRRRLLLVADGFYEWEKVDKKTKIPHLIQKADGQPFAMAGIWEKWTDPETGQEIQSCSVITTEGNELMKPIHDRMPVILPPEAWDRWLDPENEDTAALQELLVPFPAEQMRERKVSKRVGDVKNKDAAVQEPYEAEPDEPKPKRARSSKAKSEGEVS
jgi:putative SOS response-associated peptidase YedK